MPRLNSIRERNHLREHLRQQSQSYTSTISLCGGTGCQASNSRAVAEGWRTEIARHGLEERVRLCVTGCHGFCEQGPVMVIEPGNILYCHATPEDSFEIVYQTVMKGEIIEHLLYTDPLSGEKCVTEAEIPFYKAQDRQILSRNRMVDPCSIGDYIASGGYSALSLVLNNGYTPGRIINEVRESGLRGRGGGGFPTGRKGAGGRGGP